MNLNYRNTSTIHMFFQLSFATNVMFHLLNRMHIVLHPAKISHSALDQNDLYLTLKICNIHYTFNVRISWRQFQFNIFSLFPRYLLLTFCKNWGSFEKKSFDLKSLKFTKYSFILKIFNFEISIIKEWGYVTNLLIRTNWCKL